MNNKKDNKVKIQRIEIENKKIWNKWSANHLYDMYAEKAENSDAFALHAKGVEKRKNPPPVEPPVDIQGSLNLILQKLNQHDQRFNIIEKRLNSVDDKLTNVDERLGTVEKRLDTVEKRLDTVEKQLNTVVELNNLKTGDNHK